MMLQPSSIILTIARWMCVRRINTWILCLQMYLWMN